MVGCITLLGLLVLLVLTHLMLDKMLIHLLAVVEGGRTRVGGRKPARAEGGVGRGGGGRAGALNGAGHDLGQRGRWLEAGRVGRGRTARRLQHVLHVPDVVDGRLQRVRLGQLPIPARLPVGQLKWSGGLTKGFTFLGTVKFTKMLKRNRCQNF